MTAERAALATASLLGLLALRLQALSGCVVVEARDLG